MALVSTPNYGILRHALSDECVGLRGLGKAPSWWFDVKTWDVTVREIRKRDSRLDGAIGKAEGLQRSVCTGPSPALLSTHQSEDG